MIITPYWILPRVYMFYMFYLIIMTGNLAILAARRRAASIEGSLHKSHRAQKPAL